MSFITKLFKRKPGGTLIGNLFRGVVSNATGGLLGQGTGMISQLDADKRDMDDVSFEAKYGMTKSGVPTATANPANNTPATLATVDPKDIEYVGLTNKQKVELFFKKNAWAKFVVAAFAIIPVAWMIWKKIKKSKRRY